MAKLSGSMEDYLEAIFVLSEQRDKVRVKHIADFLSVSRPSVVSAVSFLHQNGLVNHAPYADVSLTDQGRVQGEAIYARHLVLRRFLEEFLGLPHDIAERDACRMEHLLAPKSVARVQAFLEFLEGSEEARTLVSQFQASQLDES